MDVLRRRDRSLGFVKAEFTNLAQLIVKVF
jgi:hypothetical protein